MRNRSKERKEGKMDQEEGESSHERDRKMRETDGQAEKRRGWEGQADRQLQNLRSSVFLCGLQLEKEVSWASLLSTALTLPTTGAV